MSTCYAKFSKNVTKVYKILNVFNIASFIKEKQLKCSQTIKNSVIYT